jgi:hypothetical protein
VTEHVIEEEYDALVVGGPEGLYRVEADGRDARLLSPGPALAPRWLSLGSVLVLRPREQRSLAKGAALERISLRDGQRTQLAELPPFACANASAQPAGLQLGDPNDFRVVHEAHVACLRLRDRGESTVVLDAEVDLKTGRVARTLVASVAGCKASAPVPAIGSASPCRSDADADARVVEAVNAYPFNFEHEQLLDTSKPKRPVLTLRAYALEEMSPSGRWLVLGGDPVQSETPQRRLVLLDRQEGALFALSEKPGPWPAPLLRLADEKRKKTRALPTPIEPAALVSRETEAHWIGDAEHELLVLGNLVVPPGKASFALPGELAR